MASQAQADTNWNNYVGFLEGLSVLEDSNWKRRQIIEEEICETYARLDNPKRYVWHLDFLAHIYTRVKAYEKAKQILAVGFQISQSNKYQKGVAHILLRAGLLLDAQENHAVACRFIHQAKLIFNEIGSTFSITARDILSNIVTKNGINASEYEVSDSAEDLMNEFVKS